jgi:predicted nuclease of predicted toxin-antitoxin system
MSIGLLANENFPVPAVRKLRAAGIDVVAVTDVMPAAADTEVLAFARQQGRWIVTFDRDYGELVFKDGLPAPPAILYLRQEPYPPDRPADLVLAMLSEPSLAAGFLVVISERGVRRKRFPELAGG